MEWMLEVGLQGWMNLRTDERAYRWFRKKGRPGREEDRLGPFKYVEIGSGEGEFTFDRAKRQKSILNVTALEHFSHLPIISTANCAPHSPVV